MKRKILSLVLAAVLMFGLAAPAVAYSTPDFSDVPSNHWAYEAVMKMADAGVIKGTGNGQFSPDSKVSSEMLLTLVGRIAFSEVVVREGDSWYGPYVEAAQKAGWLEGTNIDPANTSTEVTRYDMAVILARAAQKLSIAGKTADTSKIKDFGEIPNKYTAAVTQVYGNGLITGDGNGNFNGNSTMRRDEAATVMSRLIALKPGGSTTTEPDIDPDPVETEPERPTDPPAEVKMVSYSISGNIRKTDHAIGRPVDDKRTYLPNVPFKVYYTDDGGATSTLVAEGVTGHREWNGNVPEGEGEGQFALTLELPEDAFSGANRNKKGIYVSADTRLDGQRLVSSDLRTDGRAYIELWRPSSNSNGLGGNYRNIELTPPDGEKARFTVAGYVVAGVNPDGSWASVDGYHPPDFTVQLFFKDGTLLGEAVTDSDGKFSIDCAIDALDGGFDRSQKLYYTKVSGYIGSDLYREAVIYPADGSPFLDSLVDLGVVPDLNISTLRRLELTVDKAEAVDARQEAYNNRNK